MTPTLFGDVDPVTRRKVRAWKAWEPYKIGDYEFNGIVVSGTVLLDAEDSEIISGGMNSKGDHAAALAREANLFHWGAGASPGHMTEEARRVFVNTIVYMKQFDGAKQTVWRGPGQRTYMLSQFATVRSGLKSLQQENLPEIVKSDLRAKLSWDIRYMQDRFPPEVRGRFQDDAEKYRALYEPNLGYVYVPQNGLGYYIIDEDARSLGIPNNEVRFLERAVELLNQPAEAAKARRLLERYTGLSFSGEKAWRQWLEANRGRLHFSDYYGYRWHTGPAGPPPPLAEAQMALQEMKMEEPDQFTPMSLGAVAVGYLVLNTTIIKDGKGIEEPIGYLTNKGALVTLIVRMKIADGWHTYARVPEGGPFKATKINIDLPPGAHWRGEWQTPVAYETGEPGLAEYRDDAIFTRQLYFSSIPSSKDRKIYVPVTLNGAVYYQICDEERCMPPTYAPFQTKILLSKHNQ